MAVSKTVPNSFSAYHGVEIKSVFSAKKLHPLANEEGSVYEEFDAKTSQRLALEYPVTFSGMAEKMKLRKPKARKPFVADDDFSRLQNYRRNKILDEVENARRNVYGGTRKAYGESSRYSSPPKSFGARIKNKSVFGTRGQQGKAKQQMSNFDKLITQLDNRREYEIKVSKEHEVKTGYSIETDLSDPYGFQQEANDFIKDYVKATQHLKDKFSTPELKSHVIELCMNYLQGDDYEKKSCRTQLEHLSTALYPYSRNLKTDSSTVLLHPEEKSSSSIDVWMARVKSGTKKSNCSKFGCSRKDKAAILEDTRAAEEHQRKSVKAKLKANIEGMGFVKDHRTKKYVLPEYGVIHPAFSEYQQYQQEGFGKSHHHVKPISVMKQQLQEDRAEERKWDKFEQELIKDEIEISKEVEKHDNDAKIVPPEMAPIVHATITPIKQDGMPAPFKLSSLITNKNLVKESSESPSPVADNQATPAVDPFISDSKQSPSPLPQSLDLAIYETKVSLDNTNHTGAKGRIQFMSDKNIITHAYRNPFFNHQTFIKPGKLPGYMASTHHITGKYVPHSHLDFEVETFSFKPTKIYKPKPQRQIPRISNARQAEIDSPEFATLDSLERPTKKNLPRLNVVHRKAIDAKMKLLHERGRQITSFLRDKSTVYRY